MRLAPEQPAQAQLFTAQTSVSVVVPRPLKALDYRVPDGMTLKRGDIVEVPLGKSSTCLGVVWGMGEGGLDEARLKTVAHRFDVRPLKEDLLRFIAWVANYVVATPGGVIDLVLRVPDALEPERPSVAFRRAGREVAKLTDARRRVLGGAAGRVAFRSDAGAATAQLARGDERGRARNRRRALGPISALQRSGPDRRR